MNTCQGQRNDPKSLGFCTIFVIFAKVLVIAVHYIHLFRRKCLLIGESALKYVVIKCGALYVTYLYPGPCPV